MGSDFNFLIPESEEIKYHSFQDSLFMFISYTSEKQGKPGFKQILDRQEKEMQEFRDSVKAWASELDKIKPETRLQYEQKKKAEKTLREKVLEERKKSEQFYKSERNRFNIRDVWKAQLVVLNLLNREIQVNTKLALSQPDNFHAGNTAYNDRSITAQVPAAISSSFIATIIKDVNKKETVSIFDREGNRLHEVSASDFNYVHTMKIIQDSLLFTMSGGGKFDVIDLSTGEFIWRKRSSSYNRYRLLERQTSSDSEIVYLYARERTNKGSSFSETIKSFNLNSGKLETIYNLSEVKNERDKLYEIHSGVILSKRIIESNDYKGYLIQIFKKD